MSIASDEKIINEINDLKEDTMDAIGRKFNTSPHVPRVPVERDAVLAAFRNRKIPDVKDRPKRQLLSKRD